MSLRLAASRPPLPCRNLRIRPSSQSHVFRPRHLARIRAFTPPSSPHIRTSGFNWTSVAVYLASGAAVGIGFGILQGLRSSPENHVDVGADSIDVSFDDDMVQQAKGRPGNLTESEEQKLRELWQLMLEVTGVNSPNGISEIADSLGNDDKHGTAAAFKAALADSTPAEIRDAFWGMVKHDHPDALLLRFLRARKWDVNAALVMAISALHWRLVESKVDSDIMVNGEEGMLKWSQGSGQQAKEGGDFMSQIRMGKSFLHGRDKEGRPICYVRVRLHKPGQECEESIERFTVYTIETARMFLRPPVDTATIVFDMTDFGMANMDYAPVKFMIKCFEANYPESLGVVLVHNAPWIFNAVWKVIKGWLDPVVASKIHFTNNLKDVEAFIDRGSIIKELGGPLDWQYKYSEPVKGENAAMDDGQTREKLEQERASLSKEYEDVIQDWIADAPPADADALRKRRDETAARIRKNYWSLDPFVRARSIYDRTGELQAEGASAKPAGSALNVPSSAENSGRPSVDSVAQSFHTSRTHWEDEVD